MASTFFGLNIGVSALNSFQVATNTTANNIANVKTTGFTRQSATLTAKDALNVTARYGSVGTGDTGRTMPTKVFMSRSFIILTRFRIILRITELRSKAFQVYFHRCFQTLIH